MCFRPINSLSHPIKPRTPFSSILFPECAIAVSNITLMVIEMVVVNERDLQRAIDKFYFRINTETGWGRS